MASAQVLPNSAASSRKQEHLQAGKRRLEEFRKKKAAERAKKVSSASQNPEPDINLNDKQPLETENVRARDSDGAGSSNGPGNVVNEPSSAVINNGNNTIDYSYKIEQASSYRANSSLPFLKNDHNSLPSDQLQRHDSDQDIKKYSDIGIAGTVNGTEGILNNYGEYGGALGRYTTPEQSTLCSQGRQSFDISTSQPNFLRMDGSQSKEHKMSFDSTISNDGSSFHSVTKISPQNSISAWLQTEPNASTMVGGTTSTSLYEDLNGPTAPFREFGDEMGRNTHSFTKNSESISSKMVEKNLNSNASGFSSVQSAAAQTFESTGFMPHIRSSSNPAALYSSSPENSSRRSRPSFLDSLLGPKVTSGTSFQGDETEESLKSSSLKPNTMDFAGPSPFHKPAIDGQSTSPFSNLDSLSPPHAIQPSTKSSLLNGNSRNHEFFLPKQNEDFTALEQHIEDLTQEKFALQRALEASRALSESLAAENSSLTETYNQQRGLVDQLKSEMEKLQEEIKAQLAELEAFRNEYANTKLECIAADERAKLLASEVIGLEEKALRLRSSELKLERQLENSQEEISSCKKKLSSMEKDRMDLQSTIEALQEEKKLLQSKLMKAVASGNTTDVKTSATNKKEVSTSTEDLANEDAIPDTSSQETSGNDASSFHALLSNLELSSDSLPPDQMRMIQNINALIAELALEKEDLIQTLTSESSHCSKLKELNNELSRKLEVQTQRLELLTAQSMVGEHIPTRLPDSNDIPDNTRYADEGDEVVERVLGWIMKLFPGGPSKRRTSKLL